MHHILIILLHFVINSALGVIYDCCIYIVKILSNDALLYISSHLYIQLHH